MINIITKKIQTISGALVSGFALSFLSYTTQGIIDNQFYNVSDYVFNQIAMAEHLFVPFVLAVFVRIWGTVFERKNDTGDDNEIEENESSDKTAELKQERWKLLFVWALLGILTFYSIEFTSINGARDFYNLTGIHYDANNLNFWTIFFSFIIPFGSIAYGIYYSFALYRKNNR